MNVYTEYFRSAKNWFVIAIIFILFLVTQTLMSGASYFVSVWTNWEEQNKASAEPPQSSWSTNRFVYIYSAIIVLLIIAIILRSFSFFMMCIRISANLHNMLYEGVIRAKMYFFNVNSSGRILNRFSRDIGTIDSFLPTVLVDTINVSRFSQSWRGVRCLAPSSVSCLDYTLLYFNLSSSLNSLEWLCWFLS